MKKKRYVLLDRDGTVIVEKNYLSNPKGVELIPNAAIALRKLKELGLGLIIVSNQSGIGRGYFSLKSLEAIHQRLRKVLEEQSVVLDGIYFCPHTPNNNCGCRKPKLGLIEKASRDHNFDPALSFVVGDNKGDIELGKNIGATTILVRTGYGKKIEKEKLNPDYIVDDLKDALSIIQSAISE